MFRTLRSATPLAAMVAQFFGFGIAAGIWSGSVPAVARAAHMGTESLGTAFTGFIAAYILAMSLGGSLLRFASPRQLLLASLPVNILAVIWFLRARDELEVGLALASIGLVMGLIDLVMNREGTQVEADLRRPILSRLHGSASLGSGIGALAGSGFAMTIGTWGSVALAVIGLGAAFAVVAQATPDRPVTGSLPAGSERRVMSSYLLVLGIIFGIGVAGESAAGMWSARLLEEQAPRLAAISGIGMAFFAFCQALTRNFGDRLRRFYGDRRLIAVSLLVATSGFTAVGQSQSLEWSVLGFALVGFGTALMVPCLFALAAATAPHNAGAALSFVSMVAGIPRILSPWAFGAIANSASTSIAFGLIAVTFIAAFGLVFAASRQRSVLAS